MTKRKIDGLAKSLVESGPKIASDCVTPFVEQSESIADTIV